MVEQHLAQGTQVAGQVAQKTLDEVRRAMMLEYPFCKRYF